ncbi:MULTISPECIES: bifunctional DNA primase/polymerase [unclassified Streptomyces]|uniref:bifunctional DNA primase/polymerase n=1 Tax=unclassified Streptomyces TaxID=2593676 RepID=UPI002F90DAC6
MAHELDVSCSDSGQYGCLPAAVPSGVALARWCASRGWPVHPLVPGRGTPTADCEECRRPGHNPSGCACLQAGRWCHGLHAATLDFARIEQWWSTHPGLGVGVACGPANLVVIDIDAHGQQPPDRDLLLPGIPIPRSVDLGGLANGFHTLGVLAALRGAVSPADDETTLRVRTPSGGLHVWYRARGSHRWQCSTGSNSSRALAWQVDVRAHGGYTVVPGTVAAAGIYTAVGPMNEPAALPNWLAHELARTGHLPPADVPAPRPVPPRARQAVIAAGGGRGPAGGAFSGALGEVTACAAVPGGAAFSAKLNHAAYTAGWLVADGHLSEAAAEQALSEAAERARPGQARRYGAIIRSGFNAGLLRPQCSGGRA